MAIADSRDQAFSLLIAANNHADLAVRLSSLKQAKDIFSSLFPSSAADLFPYLTDLQGSPHSLVRKFLVEIIEDIALKAIEHSSLLVLVLVAFLRDVDSDVVKQSIVSGRNFFCCVLEEMALQFQQNGKVDQCLEELWIWMVRFKDGVFSTAMEPGPLGAKLLSLKFLETYVLLFTSDNVDSANFLEATRGSRQTFNVSWLSGGHPILDPVALTSDANRTLFILLGMLQSASSLPVSVTITIVNCKTQSTFASSSAIRYWRKCLFLVLLLLVADDTVHCMPADIVMRNCILQLQDDRDCNDFDNDFDNQLLRAVGSIMVFGCCMLFAGDSIGDGFFIPMHCALLVSTPQSSIYCHQLYTLFLPFIPEYPAEDLAAIARKRPLHYGTVLSALLDFNPNCETLRGCHYVSIQFSLRTAFLGFLRCTYPAIVEVDLTTPRLLNDKKILRPVRLFTAHVPDKLGIIFYDQSRERLLRALRAMNAGDAADQVIRQVEKMIKNSERASRETRSSRDDQSSRQPYVVGDVSKKRFMPQDNEELTNGFEMVSKCIHSGSNSHPIPHAQINDSGQDFASVNGQSPSFPLSDGNLTAVGQMISMAGALLAEGERERGAESLEILISKIHSDLLADIVITNMSHFPKSPPPLTSFGTLLITKQTDYVNSVTQAVQPPGPTNSLDAPVAQLPSTSAATTSSSISDISIVNIAAETKRDPRRDPRRLDPRQAAVSVGVSSLPVLEDTGTAMAEFDGSISIKPLSVPVVENLPVHLTSNVQSYDKVIEGPSVSAIKQPAPEGDVLSVNEDIVPILEVNTSSNCALSPPGMVDENAAEMKVDAEAKHEIDASSFPESEENYLASTTISSLDETGRDLPVLPLYGHKIVLHILYHLYSFTVSNADDTSSYSGVIYEKFLLAVAKYLLDTFPASDKSFSRLLGEVPFLPDSALKLLDDLCCFNVFDATRKETRDAERVMQGLGVVWSLILGRPNNRQACLSKALKHHRIHFALSLVFMHDFPLFIVFLSLLPVPPWQSAVNSQDDIRGKAIQLVANKLYQLDYISGEIEQFATNMLLSAVDRHAAGAEFLHSGSADERGEMEVRSGYTSTTGSQFQEPRVSGIDSMIAESTTNSASVVSFAEAQRLISLVFSLCTKKPSLLQFLFDVYGRAPKTVKQVFHRHIPIVIRALGQSCSQLLQIISDPPQGSENLLTLVLQILTQETIPSPDLVATVKYLYETKLKDATILIPILSSLSKNETGGADVISHCTSMKWLVLPIFPRRVDLPLEKFQLALAHILQGSAHIGPALTPAKALVAIHDIIPEKGGLPLKKITDACSACFEQRTVFTLQVLAKALNQMVDQIPLPLLFMRTVIQAIDAFPTMVWRMPKLWVGFLKCVAQTQPHSFPVLLQLPPPQLESALNKYGSLRSSLAAYKNQPTRKGSLPRSTLAVLHLANESHMQQPHVSTLHPSDTSSAQVATLA
ncbi:Symplekin [Gossypium arboreum]|uniref:Symplekin n=1 Tax=Gossypium arboreum TaxID=29729 RepID=A0A0B0PVN7_GOSAR|nr:Symplekin [Gossypium arboreum]